MLSKLTIVGLHEFGTSSNDDLFEHLTLPEGIDKDILVNEILKKGRSFSVLYPDFDFMKMQIAVWSEKWFHNFERWVEAYNFKYEALFNVDVKTETTVHDENTGSSSRNTSNIGESSGGNGITNTTSKAAYDSSSFQNTSKEVSDGNSHNNSEIHGTDDLESSDIRDVKTTELKQGNQGVTMSQEMLLSEYNAWKWNLYDHIADVFINEFCIMIYD